LAKLAQLWASVEAGNTKAAVALADLYLRGNGVPVNCDQAFERERRRGYQEVTGLR